MSSGGRHMSGGQGVHASTREGSLTPPDLWEETGTKKAAGQRAANVIQTCWQITCCFYNGGNYSQGVFFPEWNVFSGQGGGGCDKGGGVEVDMRSKGFILQWQQGATRGPLKAARRITSSSFPPRIQAPVEGVIVPRFLSAGCRAHKCFVKSYLATEEKPPLLDKISSNTESEGVGVWRCFIWLQREYLLDTGGNGCLGLYVQRLDLLNEGLLAFTLQTQMDKNSVLIFTNNQWNSN